jgi:membrane associated rhomboid family serine protease
MDQTTSEARTLIEQGDALLLQGQVTEAATAFSRAVELDQSVPHAHLGVAEANLALGAYNIVTIACRKVLELAPSSADGALARAILFTLDQRYDAAVFDLERVETLDPGRAYAHALRAYCLRKLGRNGDAALASAKAARLSGNRDLEKLFPADVAVMPAANAVVSPNGNYGNPATTGNDGTPGRISYAQQRPWSERSAAERQMMRARVATFGVPVVTYTLIAINILVYIVGALLSHDFISPLNSANCLIYTSNGMLAGCSNKVYEVGLVQGLLIQQSPTQVYRLLTSMFLHENIIHIGVNMWSLYAVGVATERIFGSRRYLAIYLLSGLVGGILQVVLSPAAPALGASGAIFGIFGAFGAFVFLRRRLLGPAANAIIGQMLFILLINIVLDFSVPGIGIADHAGGLISGFIIGAIMVSLSQRSRRGGTVV